MVQRDLIELGVHTAAREKRGERGREAQTSVDTREVDRLDAETVTGEEEAAGVVLVESECEHADELLDAPGTPVAVGFQDHLRVAR